MTAKNTSTTHPPYDTLLEQAAIGIALADPARLEVLATLIKPETFCDPLHTRIFATMLRLMQAGAGGVSVATVHAALKADPGITTLAERMGSTHAYFESLHDNAPIIANVAVMAGTLNDLAERRKLEEIGKWLVEGANQPPEDEPTKALVEEATHAILAVGASYGSDRTQSLAAVARSRVEAAEKRLAGGEIQGIPTGLSRMDKAVGLLQPGDHVLLAGRSGAGKSALAASIGRAAAQSGAPVLIICADMTKERWAERVLCEVDFHLNGGEAPLSYGWFRGRLQEPQIERILVAQNEVAGWACDICDEGQITTSRIRAKVRAMANRYRGQQGLLITDFLQKIPRDLSRKDQRRDEDLTANTYDLGDIVKDAGWAGLTLAQLKNKDTDSRGKIREDEPNETDIRESGGLIQAVDIAFAIHRKAYFVERREPAGRDFHPEPPPDWVNWKAEMDTCRDEAAIIGFKNRDSSVSSLQMTLWCSMASNVFLDQKPASAFRRHETEELRF